MAPELTILTAQHVLDDPRFPVEESAVVIEDYVCVGNP
jgi:hypothetical protein